MCRTERHRTEDDPVVLHLDRRLTATMLDHLADAGVPLGAPCGQVRVPRRPPYPEGWVLCPICADLDIELADAIEQGRADR